MSDYGGATKIEERVRERTVSYYPSDAGDLAKKKTDFMLLTVLLLEMFGAVSSPPGSMTAEEIKSKVASVEDEEVKAFFCRFYTSDAADDLLGLDRGGRRSI